MTINLFQDPAPRRLLRDETNWLRPYQHVEKRVILKEIARLDANPPQTYQEQQYHADLGTETSVRESKYGKDAQEFQQKKRIGESLRS